MNSVVTDSKSEGSHNTALRLLSQGYVVTDSKSEGSHNLPSYNAPNVSVVTDSKSEGSHNGRFGQHNSAVDCY